MKATKVKIYPNKEQAQKMERMLGTARWVYNHFLALSKKHYILFSKKEGYKRKNSMDFSRHLTKIKKTEKYSWIKEASSTALIYKLRDLESAFLKFFKEKAVGFPRFKKKFKKDTIKFKGNTQGEIKIIENKIYIPKIGWINYRGKTLNGRIINGTVRRYFFGRWEVSLTYEIQTEIISYTPKTPLGIDINCHNITLSTDEKIDFPLYNFENKIKYWQKTLSRRKKGSNRRLLARKMLTKWHYHAGQKREYFLKEVVFKITEYCKKHECFVVLETINLKNLTAKGGRRKTGLNRSLLDTTLGALRTFLAQKGVEIRKVDRFFPSSKLCSNCGEKNKELTLAQKKWECVNCSEVHDRDINAARNLRNYGLREPLVETA